MTLTCPAPCRCWTTNTAIGHDGHCCFLIDNRTNIPMREAWKPLDEICDPPHGTDDALDQTTDTGDPLAYNTPDVQEPPC